MSRLTGKLMQAVDVTKPFKLGILAVILPVVLIASGFSRNEPFSDWLEAWLLVWRE